MPLTAAAGACPHTPGGPVALLVGGPAFPDRLDGAAAAKLATDALAYAVSRNATLNAEPARARRRRHRRASTRHHPAASPRDIRRGENRYKATLAEASEIIVTSDSVSMVSDALASGRPVSVYPVPQSRNLKWQAGEWLYINAVEQPLRLLAPVKWLFDIGLIEAAADRRRLFARLVAEKRLVWFGDDPVPPQPHAMRRDLEGRSSLCVH